jgi:cytoskeletal protein RodZ
MIAFPGNELKTARQAIGLTRAQVFEKTRIPLEYIVALETGALGALPGAIYTLGFVKSYCEAVGLDPELYADIYRACSHPAAAPINVPKKVAPKQPIAALPKWNGEMPRWATDALTWAAICGILLFAWVAFNSLVKPFAHDAKDRVNAGTVELAPPKHFDDEF